jgi:hypothetical protein
MKAVERFTPLDFEPAVIERQVHAISRPSLSYWQDAGRRLRSNWRASASLAIIAGLVAFAIAGPWVWRVDPAAQDIDQISQAPSLPSTALIVEPSAPWAGVTTEPIRAGQAVTGLRLAQPATRPERTRRTR